MSYETREDVAAKIAWEGGLDDAMDYGLTADDMPDPVLAGAWRTARAAWLAYQEELAYVEELLEDALEA